MTIVVDASAIVALLVDDGVDGRWVEQQLSDATLVGPHLLHIEVASVLRRAVLSGDLSSDAANLAYRNLFLLPIELSPLEPFARRVWDLRPTVTAYDAWYVALAEALDAPLVTLDARLAGAPGPTCTFVVPA
ncbi:MAG: putative nucleic acid-binding protein [Candidatus Poriferisodalaceae bacterium]|jgi:predicted nucleic acid-binding protein